MRALVVLVDVDGRGLEVATVFERLRPVVDEEVGVGFGATLPFIVDSLARLAVVWRTLGVFFDVLGAGLALNAGFFSSTFASAAARASLAAFSLAATASPGSWKELLVGALVLFGGGGGVGKDMEIGRDLLCGIAASFFSRGSSFSSLVALLLEVDVTRFPAVGATLCLTLLERPRAVVGTVL